MNYTIISPLGKRQGLGTFETFFDTDKYSTIEEAIKQNDVVVVNFVEDEQGYKQFEFYHTQTPQIKKYKSLNWADMRCGIDVMDDNMACETANEMLKVVNHAN